jgi:hypothetical protein
MNVVERMRDEAKAETTPGLSLHRASGDDEQDDGDAAYQSLSGRYSPFS